MAGTTLILIGFMIIALV